MPRNPVPLASMQFERVFEAAPATDDLADRRAFGTMGAAIDRTIPGGFLTGPQPILHLGKGRATHRAVRTDVAPKVDSIRGRSRWLCRA